MDLLAKLCSLSALERRELLLAVVLLPAIDITLRAGGLRLVQRTFGPESSAGERAPLRSDLDAAQLARLVAAAARWGPYGGSCMVRSLALQWLLKRHGLEGTLRLGVRKTGDRLEAHAWIEYEGKPLIDPANVSGEFPPFEPISPDLRV